MVNRKALLLKEIRLEDEKENMEVERFPMQILGLLVVAGRYNSWEKRSFLGERNKMYRMGTCLSWGLQSGGCNWDSSCQE